jgi:hypothetical protein
MSNPSSRFYVGQQIELIRRSVTCGSRWLFLRSATVLKVTPKQVVFSGLGKNPPERAWIETGEYVGFSDFRIRPVSEAVAKSA